MLEKIKVLCVDDNFISRKAFAEALSKESFGARFELEQAADSKEFLSKLKNFKPDIVVLDIHLAEDDIDGLGLLARVKGENPEVVAFMRSSQDDAATIRNCLQQGADDFIAKSYDSGALALRLLKAFQLAQFQHGKQAESAEAGETPMAGETMQRVAKRVAALVKSAVTAVHIQGESGTGKEVVATMIGSYDRQKPFIRVNCGAINPSLLESELFGHVKGAFTGADRDRKGYIQAAANGWLFLDEVASLSVSAQVALLRVLETNEVTPLGSYSPQKAVVRVISASNEPLETLVGQGRFRRDLWQRLMETQIELPALRHRKEEIPDLVQHFCQTMSGGPYTINPTALKLLQSYDWNDGNVRELRNCLRAMTEVHVNKELTLLSFPQRMLHRQTSVRPEPLGSLAPDESDLIRIPIDAKEVAPYHFENLSDRLLSECVKHITRKTPRISIRDLADKLVIPKSSLARRIKVLQQKNWLDGIPD